MKLNLVLPVLIGIFILGSFGFEPTFVDASSHEILLGGTSGEEDALMYLIDPNTGLSIEFLGELIDEDGMTQGISGLDVNSTGAIFSGGNNQDGDIREIFLESDGVLGVIVIDEEDLEDLEFEHGCNDVAFAPDGTFYCYGKRDGGLFLIDLDAGTKTLVGLGNPDNWAGNGLAVSVDGTLYHGTREGLNVLDTTTGIPITSIPWEFDSEIEDSELCRPSAMDFSSEGILFASLNCSIWNDSNFNLTHLVTIDFTTDPTFAQVTLIGTTIPDLTAITFVSIPVDTDGDGILDNIDPLPTDSTNNSFNDGTTSGTIIRGDQILVISDATSPDGVSVVADLSGGLLPATITDCEGTIYTITPGDNVIVTCGSSIIQVVEGPVEVEYFVEGSGFATATLDTGDNITFEQETLTFTNTGTGIIEVIVNEKTIIIMPDEVVVISNAPRILVQDAQTELSTLIVTDKKDQKRIEKVDKAIDKSLEDKLWIDDSTLTKKGKKVFDENKKAVKELGKVKSVDVSSIIGMLTDADQSLAQTAIDLVPTDTGDKKVDKELDKANKETDKALEELEKGKPDKAIDKFKKAWEHAQKALKKKK